MKVTTYFCHRCGNELTDDEINRLEIKDCRDKSPVIATMKLLLEMKGIEA